MSGNVARTVEYFSRNGITMKSVDDATGEQMYVAEVLGSADDETEYYKQYFLVGLDNLLDCVDQRTGIRSFQVLVEQADQFSDVFEPCCQSGLLGCYLAAHVKAYKGIDIEPEAIAKSKRRAVINGLNPDIFSVGDVFSYDKQHEALFGRYVVNGRFNDVRDDMMEAVSRISNNVVLIQQAQASRVQGTVDDLKQAFERFGYRFELLNHPEESDATGAYVFVMKATKP